MLQRKIGDLWTHGKAERPFLIRAEADDDDIVWVRGKVLACIGDPVLLIRNVGDGFVEVERAPVVLYLVLVEIEKELGEASEASFAVNTSVVKRFIRDLNTLGIGAPEDGNSSIAVANRVRPSLPVPVIGLGPFTVLGRLPLTPPIVRRGFRLPEFIGPRCAPGQGCQSQTSGQQQINVYCFFHKFPMSYRGSAEYQNRGSKTSLYMTKIKWVSRNCVT